MGIVYKKLVRPLLFRKDAEQAHHLAIKGLKCLGCVPLLPGMMRKWNMSSDATRPIELFGIRFPNRVGLAAGFDKNADIWRVVPSLGFGHVEIGTVTGEAQPGNPKPRMFRYPEQRAVLNRMGFNNAGAEAIATRLKKQAGRGKRIVPLGINLGKSKVVPVEEAVGDYLKSFRLLAPFADYVTINVSSPNTPGLRGLQEAGPLRELLNAIQAENRALAGDRAKPLPVLLKIAPDLSFHQVEEILEIVESAQIAGIIATNTTLRRPGKLAGVQEAGGISGEPVFPYAYRIVSFIAKVTQGRLPIIAVGGICSETEAGEMMNAGASLVQLYSGMVFEGPFLAARVARSLNVRDHADWVY